MADGNIKLGIGASVDTKGIKAQMSDLSKTIRTDFDKVDNEVNNANNSLDTMNKTLGSVEKSAKGLVNSLANATSELAPNTRALLGSVKSTATSAYGAEIGADIAKSIKERFNEELNNFGEVDASALLRAIIDDMGKASDDAEQSARELAEKYALNYKSTIESSAPPELPTPEQSDVSAEPDYSAFDKYRRAVTDAKDALDDLIAEQQRMESLGVGTGYKVYDQLQVKIALARDRYNELVAQQERFTQQGMRGYSQLYQALTNWKLAVGEVGNSLKNLNPLTGLKNAIQGIAAKFVNLGATILNGVAHPIQSVKNGFALLGSTASKTKNLISSGFKKISVAVNSVKNAVKGLISRFKALTKSGRSSSNDMQKGFKKAFTTFLKLGLGVRGTFALIRKLRTALLGAFKDLASQSDEFNAQMSGFKTALNQVKGSLATAFQPIASAVLPLLTTLLNGLNNVLVAIGKFNAVMTGQNYIYKATAAQADYAESVKESGDAAEESSKKLGAYDKLQVIGDDKKDSGSGGDAGSGITYDKASVEGASSDFANMIKNAWKASDFTEVGEYLNQQFGNFVSIIEGFAPKISVVGNKIATSLATLINGFTADTTPMTRLGSAVATGLNGIVSSLNTFLTTTNFKQVGNFIGSGLNSLLTNVDYDGIGKLLANKWNAIFDFVKGFADSIDFGAIGKGLINGFNSMLATFDASGAAESILSVVNGLIEMFGAVVAGYDPKLVSDKIVEFFRTLFGGFDWVQLLNEIFTMITKLIDTISLVIQQVDWGQVARDIVAGFASLDWAGIAQSFFGMIGNALGALASVVGQLIADGIAGAKSYFQGKIEECGGNVVGGIFKGIKDALVNIVTWINTNIFTPFINGFKKVFKIHSPSGVMAEQGNFIMQGLYNGITGLISKVVGAFSTLWTNIKNVFVNIPTWFKEKFTSACNNVKSAFSTIGSFFTDKWNAIKSTFAGTGDYFKTQFATAWARIKEKFSLTAIVAHFKAIVAGIKAAFIAIPSWFKNTFSSAWTKVKNVFSKGGEIFDGIKEGIVDGLKVVINGLIGGINKVISGTFNGLNKILKKIKDVDILGVTPFKNFVKTIDVPEIPLLANGAVIPPNREFMAVLGDQKHGTNIETPLDTMVQAFNMALAQNGATNMPKEINLYLSKNSIKPLAQAIWDEQQKRYRQLGTI